MSKFGLDVGAILGSFLRIWATFWLLLASVFEVGFWRAPGWQGKSPRGPTVAAQHAPGRDLGRDKPLPKGLRGEGLRNQMNQAEI